MNGTKTRMRQMGVAAGATAVLVMLAVQVAAVEPPPSRKMGRQIEVMEKIIDQVLLESPNFLIRGLPVTRGAYIPSFGVLFTFDASLVMKDWEQALKMSLDLPQFRVEERDGHKVIIIPEGRMEIESDDEESSGGEGKSKVEIDLGDWRDKRRERQEEVYGAGKAEIVGVLLDYGDTLTTLESDQWVAIMAYVTDEDFIDRRKFSRLILKVKVSDLKAYASGDLSEENLVKRIVEQEF